MKNWIQRNVKNIIVTAFVIPILLVAFVSISHVTSFYGISNPITWAIYLSVGIEIAALSALAAVSVNMGRFVYLPFFIVTLIQMIGNIFFSFSYIDETGQQFKDWVEMVGGLFENMGVDRNDLSTHKTIISFLSGGLLPIISLTFAHMLVKFSENKEEKESEVSQPMVIDLPEIIAKKNEEDEKSKYQPTEEELELLEKILTGKYTGPEQVKKQTEVYQPTEEDISKFEEILNLNNNVDEPEVILDVLKTEELIPEPQVEIELEIIETQNEPEVILDFVKIEEFIPEPQAEIEPEVTPEVKIELPELIQEVTPQNFIEEDKKKTDDESEIDEDYKVLNYTKRNG